MGCVVQSGKDGRDWQSSLTLWRADSKVCFVMMCLLCGVQEHEVDMDVVPVDLHAEVNGSCERCFGVCQSCRAIDWVSTRCVL